MKYWSVLLAKTLLLNTGLNVLCLLLIIHISESECFLPSALNTELFFHISETQILNIHLLCCLSTPYHTVCVLYCDVRSTMLSNTQWDILLTNKWKLRLNFNTSRHKRKHQEQIWCISQSSTCTKCTVCVHDGHVELSLLAHPALSCCGQAQVEAFSQEWRGEPSVSSLSQ